MMAALHAQFPGWDDVHLVAFDVDGTLYDQRRLRVLMARDMLLDAALRRSLDVVTILRTYRHIREQLAEREVPEFDRIRLEQFEQIKIIVMQDQATQVALQQAYHSRYAPRGRLSHLETAISQLNQWVIDKYQRALTDAGMD